MKDIEDIKRYVTTVVQPILKNPELLDIQTIKDDMGTLIVLDVSDEDMGRIIGKEGVTINALRIIFRQFGALHQIRLSLKTKEKKTYDKSTAK